VNVHRGQTAPVQIQLNTVVGVKNWAELDVLFGIILTPQNDIGKMRLYSLTGTPIGTPLLEGSLRKIQPLGDKKNAE
jgi:hypothetical protein